MPFRGGVLLAVSGLLAAAAIPEARPGLVNYVEGEVWAGGQKIQDNYTVLLLPDGEKLRTGAGRAEILLTDGMFLRLAENSSIRLSVKGSQTLLEPGMGDFLLEGDKHDGSEIVLAFERFRVRLLKKGMYRLDMRARQLRVYDGQAEVESGEKSEILKKGQALNLAGAAEPNKFDRDPGDAFSRWSKRRAETLSVASFASASRAYDLGFHPSGWFYDPYLACYTFLPVRANFRNYYGQMFYTPSAMAPPPPMVMDPGFGAGPGYGISPRSSGIYGGGGRVSAPVSGAPAPGPAAAPASNPRTSDSGSRIETGGRGR